MRQPNDGQFKRSQEFNDPCCRESYFVYGLVGHNGWDVATPLWTPLYAPHDGIAKEVIDEGNVGYGKYVKVESDIEGSTIGHLAKFSVTQGQALKEGELIGYSGNSGNSTGPHYHWGYYRTKTRNRQNGFNGYIDQTDWLDHEIIAKPIAQTDQTIIDLGKFGKMEIQAIRGKMGDLELASQLIEEREKKISELIGELIIVNKELETQRDIYNSLLKAYNVLKSGDSADDNHLPPPFQTITLPPIIQSIVNWFKKWFY